MLTFEFDVDGNEMTGTVPSELGSIDLEMLLLGSLIDMCDVLIVNVEALYLTMFNIKFVIR